MTEDNNSVLWFTSTQSSKLQSNNNGGASTFEGLFMCDNFSPKTGTCSDAKLIVDSWHVPGSHHHGNGGMMEHHLGDAAHHHPDGKTHHPQDHNGAHHHGHKRGLDLMNVQIDESTNTLYTGYFDKYRNSFEILAAPLHAPVTLKSFFRTAVFSSNNACRMDCCRDGSADHTYFKVQPRDFAVDNGEVFVSWDAFYQNCASDSYTAKAGLKWTVGVSKILSSNPDCVWHDTEDADVEVNFAECTEPVAIAFQDSEARKKLLGYAGFAIANSISKVSDRVELRKRLFFLSAMRQADLNRLDNELWIVKEGDFNTSPDLLEVDSVAAINPRFADVSVDDVGTIRLRKDEHGVPTGLCRTAYDAPVVCHKVTVDENGTAKLSSKNTYVSREKVAESCSVATSDHYPASKLIASVATGLEVFWGEDSTDDNPDFLVFGCYGELNYHGNVTTAFSNKQTVQTITGAYPGSVLKGVDVHRDPDAVPHDSFQAPNHGSNFQFPKKQHATTASSSSRPSGFFLACGVLVGVVALVLRKRAKGRREVVLEYEPVVQVEIGEMSHTSYVEFDASS